MKRCAVILVLALSATAGTPASSGDHDWRWQHATVNPAREHLELRFESRAAGKSDESMAIARVGPPVDGVFPVQFVVPCDESRFSEAIAAVRRDLDYYLVELDADDPWEYAVYHTETLANLYSRVHWQWVKPATTLNRSKVESVISCLATE